MIANLILGTLVISATVLIHTFGLMTVTSVWSGITRGFPVHGHPSRAVALIVVVLGIFDGHDRRGLALGRLPLHAGRRR